MVAVMAEVFKHPLFCQQSLSYMYPLPNLRPRRLPVLKASAVSLSVHVTVFNRTLIFVCFRLLNNNHIRSIKNGAFSGLRELRYL